MKKPAPKPKPKAVVPKPKPKPTPKPKAAVPKPKAAVPKPKPKPKAAVPKAKPKQRKRKLPAGYNPITRQPYEAKGGTGFVVGGNVNLDNVTTLEKPPCRSRR